ncbi:protealysin inhibitor emfourin [Streptomyces toxytricini]|uniref:Protealysin inhibitor emfourin n=1 Tax=Streptomyces toxytricini TaxID=67369 RepID=A0ABW8EHY7_STRT5
MRVSLAVRGGLAATTHRGPPEVVDTADLPAAEAAELARLVAALTPGPRSDGPGRARDAVSYTITVEDGGRSTASTQSDAAMSPSFAALLAWLRDHFARRTTP